MPLVSVIIPTHNRRQAIGQAVASALCQTVQDLEVIVVDDGSVDGTEAAVAAIGSPRVRFFRFPENRGGSAARNEGIRNAVGEFVAFLDDDDTWEPNKLELQLAALSQSGADICWTAVRHFRVSGKVSHVSFHPFRYPSDQHRSIMADNCIGSTSSVMVRRSRADAVSGFDEAFPALQDWEFYIRLIASGCRATGIRQPLVNYRPVDRVRVSGSFARYHAAMLLMEQRFGADRHFPLLKRRLRLIEAKRMLRSGRFFLDALRYYAGLEK